MCLEKHTCSHIFGLGRDLEDRLFAGILYYRCNQTRRLLWKRREGRGKEGKRG